MLTRIDPDDPATVATLESCADAVSDLAAAPAAWRWSSRSSPTGSTAASATSSPPTPWSARNAIAAGLGTHLGLHLAEGADRRRDGAGDGGHHAARADPRRRGRPRTRTPRSRAGARRSRCRPCRAWSSAGRCSTRPATTSPRPSTPRWGCCDGRRAGRSSSRRGRPAAEGAVRRWSITPGDGRLGLQLPADPGTGGGRERTRSPPARTSASCCRCPGRLHGGLRRRGRSRSPAAAASSPASPTSPTSPATPRSPCRPQDGGRFALPRRPRDPAADRPLRPRRGRAGRAARRGPGQPAGQQLLHARRRSRPTS